MESISIFVVVALVIVASSPLRAQSLKTYTDDKGNRVTFPLGDVSFGDEVVSFGDEVVSFGDEVVSFGDEVVSFKMGDPHAAPRYSDPKEALGPPNYDHTKDTNYVTLGCGGVLTLRFTDNVLVNVNGPDLYVFEIGPQIEPTRLELSKDGDEWINIGPISGGTAAIDIGPQVKSGDVFHYVRLTDLKKECGSDFPGADIDAVGAIGSGLQISLNSAVLFDFNKYALKPEAHQELSRVVSLIQQYKRSSVVVEGHTDAVGSAEYNQQLSANRANSVRTYLEAHTKGAAIRFSSRGYGKDRPIASNDAEQGRAKNRRVEITVIPAGAVPPR